MKRSFSAFVLCLWMCCANVGAEETISLTVRSERDGVLLPVSVFKPEGTGPFPAIVIAHDCSGLGTRSSGQALSCAHDLASWGFVVAVPDSFGPRDLPNGVCASSHAASARASGYVRAADARSTLQLLSTLDYVDVGHVGILGGSHGGWTTLAAMLELPHPSNKPHFEAGIALYPPCAVPYGSWHGERAHGAQTGPMVSASGIYRSQGPVLILVGSDDDWTPASDCEKLASTSRQAGYDVKVVEFPHAQHSFDSNHAQHFDALRTNSSAPSGKGATTGGDPLAWSEARTRVRAFFVEKLGIPR